MANAKTDLEYRKLERESALYLIDKLNSEIEIITRCIVSDTVKGDTWIYVSFCLEKQIKLESIDRLTKMIVNDNFDY